MIRALVLALFVLCLAGPAHAQLPPYTYPLTLGTTSVTVLPFNPARKKVIFHNPNDQAKIAVCPVGPDRTPHASQALVVATINGAGCLTIIPYDRIEVTGGTASGPQQDMRSAWVGIASAGGSALTIWEFE
jgi:hypothetical protein